MTHDLRTSCITNLSEHMDPMKLAKYARHSSVNTTLLYVKHKDEKILQDVEDAFAVMS
jgi:integrase